MKYNLLFFFILILTCNNSHAQITSLILSELKQNNVSVIEKRLKSGLDINAQDSHGANLLMWAVYLSDLKIVDYLIAHGAKIPEQGIIFVDNKRRYYGNLQCIAAGEGKLNTLVYLVQDLKLSASDVEFSLETQKHTGWSPLLWAVIHRKTSTAKYLIEHNVYLKETYKNKILLLNTIAQEREVEILEMLVKNDKTFSNSTLQFLNEINYTKRKSLTNYLRSDWFPDYYHLSKFEPTKGNRKTYLRLLKKTLFEAQADFGDASVQYLNTCLLYFNIKYYRYSAKIYRQGVEARKKAFPIADTALALLFNQMGVIYSWNNKSHLACYYYKQALILLEKTKGRENQDYVNVANNLAIAYDNLGLPKKEIDIYEQIIPLMNKLSTFTAAVRAKTLIDLADLYYDDSDFEKTTNILEQYIKIVESEKTLMDSTYADELGFLSRIYAKLGRYEKALPAVEEAIELVKRIKGENNPQFARLLDNAGSVYSNLSQYEKAITYSLKALKIRQQTLDPFDEDISTSLNNTGFAYERNGQFEKAIDYYYKSIKITKHNYPIDSSAYATELHNLARCYSEIKELDKALPLHKKSLAIQKKVDGEFSQEYALSVGTLGNFYYRKKDFKNAIYYQKKAITLKEKVFGKRHRIYLSELENLAFSYWATGSLNLAVELFKKCNRGYLDFLQESNTSLSENEKETMISAALGSFEALPSLITSLKSDTLISAISKEIYDEQLLIKGIVLQDQKFIFNNIEKTADSVILSLYNRWKENRKQAGFQILLPKIKQTINLDSLILETNLLEQKLSVKSHAFYQKQKNRQNAVGQVSKSLTTRDVAIEFLKYDYRKKNGWTDSTLYAALVIKNNDSIPIFVPLFEENQLRTILIDSMGEVNSDEIITSLYDDENGSNIKKQNSLYGLIWKPLESFLKNSDTIYYAPAGLLNLVSFPAIKTGPDSYLIDRYTLKQTTTTLSISNKKDTSLKFNGADLWGNIHYSSMPDSNIVLGTSPELFTKQTLPDYRAKLQGFDGWPPLVGTRSELDSIQKILIEKGLEATLDTADKASENKFKGQDGHSPQLLHIATHGFFLSKKNVRKITSDDFNGNFSDQDDPMLRTGLILAGADFASSGGKISPGHEDGILTAYEIASLNLSNTKMLVLSACQTGLGDIKNAEGVYGLQRAFKIAGVGHIISTLWSIADEETVELMAIFYRNLLSGSAPREALAKAQIKMRRTHPPSIWGAFEIVD